MSLATMILIILIVSTVYTRYTFFGSNKYSCSSSDSDKSVPRRHTPSNVRVKVPLPYPVLQRTGGASLLRRPTRSLHPCHSRPRRPPGSPASAVRAASRGKRRWEYQWWYRHGSGVHTRRGRVALCAHALHGRNAHHQEKGTRAVDYI